MSFLDIKLVFMHVGEDLTLPNLMTKSVREVMPQVEIWQLTDDKSPVADYVTNVVRKPFDGYLMTFRMNHLADLTGNWISLDTDILVLKDLTHVFDQHFDVALTKRDGVILDQDKVNIVEMMPYNTGVMFSKGQGFWEEARKILQRMPESAHKWYGDQLSVRVTADTNQFKVLELDCEEYNYTPKTQNERKNVHVLHFKGQRKDWMINGNYKLQRVENKRRKLAKSHKPYITRANP